jgi:hypothetical protein
MLNEIKILLDLNKSESRDISEDNYTSFVDDLKHSANKTRPNLDDHNLIAKLVKLIRGDYNYPDVPPHVSEQGQEVPVSEGLVEKLKRLMHK